MRALRWVFATGAMTVLIVGVGTIVAAVLGAASLLALLGGVVVSVVAVVVLAVADPNRRERGASPGDPATRAELKRELERVVAEVRPRRLDPERSELTGASDTFLLAHDQRRDWDVEALVEGDEVVVSAAGTHQHFLGRLLDPNGPSSAVEASAFVAAILRGGLEVVSAYRGRFLTRIDHRVTAQPERCVRTVPITPAPLLVFLSRRFEHERPDFEPAS